MIDTHLHLDDEKFDGERETIIDGFAEHNVDFVINNSCDLVGMLAGIKLATENERVFATVGMHPHTAKDFDGGFADNMKLLANHPKVVAVGEIGLDYYYDLSERDVQRDVFAAQIEIADKLGLPIVLHVRDAYGDALDVLEAQKNRLNYGVLWHCYSGSAELARQMAKRGHYFAFGGAITFKNAKKDGVLAEIPLTQVLSETDSPYMAPEPLRGTVNTPFNMPLIVKKIAEIYGKSIEETERQIYENALRFFPKIATYLCKQ
ncbi:MAG: TatD family hydrolase [Corallococcus sp.]|nr:TatD family hydrolase [Corallococcus sp.]MCM1359641.1 TatD family hydrolase [Corallococcus sp.]MCM1395233.1 TatD family hydrolase [Corallococcus sp.]